MGLPAINLALASYQLSDLFFNFEHPEYEKVYSIADGKRAVDPAEIEIAILADAKEFCSIVGIDLADALAADFLARV